MTLMSRCFSFNVTLPKDVVATYNFAESFHLKPFFFLRSFFFLKHCPVLGILPVS